jgi:uncharacterized protein (TIGR02588 family)
MTRLHEKNGLEWAVFALALLLTLAVVIYLIGAAARHEDTPPDLRAWLGTAELSDIGVRVPVSVENRGQTAARAVILEVRIPDGPHDAIGQLEMDRVPPEATREGWVILEVTLEQAAGARVNIRGFEAP